MYGLFNDAVDKRQRSVELGPGSDRTWKAAVVTQRQAGPPTAYSGPGENIFFGRHSKGGRAGEGKSKEQSGERRTQDGH